MADFLETIKALSEFTKPVEKLIDNVSIGIGKVYEPIHIKRIANANAEANKIASLSDIEVKELAIRADERFEYQRLRRQVNIESIITKSAACLPEQVKDEPVDEDWMVRFFEYAQDIGNPEMQAIWAKILAKEVTKPDTFSLRTLEFVKTLHRNEANIFTKFSTFLWVSDSRCFTIVEHNAIDYMKSCELNKNDIYILGEIGLVSHDIFNYKLEKGESKRLFYFNDAYNIIRSEDSSISGIEVKYTTKIGTELSPISGAKPDNNYINKVQDMLSELTWEIIKD